MKKLEGVKRQKTYRSLKLTLKNWKNWICQHWITTECARNRQRLKYKKCFTWITTGEWLEGFLNKTTVTLRKRLKTHNTQSKLRSMKYFFSVKATIDRRLSQGGASENTIQFKAKLFGNWKKSGVHLYEMNSG